MSMKIINNENMLIIIMKIIIMAMAKTNENNV
jgi:hypothetical protein